LRIAIQYADDLVVIADSEQELLQKLNRWKDGLEKKAMKVNISKTKIMVGGVSSQDADRTVRWLCFVYGKGWAVTRYSPLSVKWAHRKCRSTEI